MKSILVHPWLLAACVCISSFSRAVFAEPSEEPIYLYDLTGLLDADLRDEEQVRRLWDEFHLAAALQGLVNRDAPRLYLRINVEPDDFWLERLTEEGAWCDGRRVEKIESLEELLAQFKDEYNGAVVYDERVPATSNLASTIAGVESLLPVRFDEAEDSLYQKFVTDEGVLPSRKRLLADDGSPMFTGQGMIPGTEVPSTGSPKNDAYRWLMEGYLKTEKVNPRLFGNYIDAFWLQCAFVSSPANNTLSNHDYIIANKGMFFDLHVWDDEAPVDEPSQRPGTDVETLQLVLLTANQLLDNEEMIHVAGFTPWAFKYTSSRRPDWFAGSKHEPVPTEWKFTEILSSYNGYLDADALSFSSMSNASFFQHYKLPDHIPQTPPMTREEMVKKNILTEEGQIVPRNYYAHYVGDYDSAAWVYWHLPKFWRDPARGELPLSWAFNPNLADRFGFGLHWARKNATKADHFIAGDSGAGYVNARNLSEPRPYSGLPGAMDVWEEHCEKYMGQWDISLVGFVLDGFAHNMVREGWNAYSRFSPDGIVLQSFSEPPGIHKGMPYKASQGDLVGDPEDAARVIREHFRDELPNFISFRSVLRSPTWYKQVEEEIDRQGRGDAMLVNLHTLLWLMKQDLGGGDDE